eukprot:1161127-Pelagomonas_calceolata.AAC.16
MQLPVTSALIQKCTQILPNPSACWYAHCTSRLKTQGSREAKLPGGAHTDDSLTGFALQGIDNTTSAPWECSVQGYKAVNRVQGSKAVRRLPVAAAPELQQHAPLRVTEVVHNIPEPPNQLLLPSVAVLISAKGNTQGTGQDGRCRPRYTAQQKESPVPEPCPA